MASPVTTVASGVERLRAALARVSALVTDHPRSYSLLYILAAWKFYYWKYLVNKPILYYRHDEEALQRGATPKGAKTVGAASTFNVSKLGTRDASQPRSVIRSHVKKLLAACPR